MQALCPSMFYISMHVRLHEVTPDYEILAMDKRRGHRRGRRSERGGWSRR